MKQLISNGGPVEVELVRSIAEAEANHGRLITSSGQQPLEEEEWVRLIRMPPSCDSVTEPCEGTHLTDIGDIQTFSVIGCHVYSKKTVSLQCVTGQRALAAFEAGRKLIQEMISLSHMVNTFLECKSKKFKNEAGQNVDAKKLAAKIKSLKKLLDDRRKRSYKLTGKSPIPYVVRVQVTKILDQMTKQLKTTVNKELFRKSLAEEIDETIKSQSDQPFLVHFLKKLPPPS